MEQNQRNVISNVLKKLSFVNWDRYFGEVNNLTFFGWIDREDNYKDFVILQFDKEKVINFITSSKEYTKEIAELLNFTHTSCNRIEYFCDGENIIKEDASSEKEVGGKKK